MNTKKMLITFSMCIALCVNFRPAFAVPTVQINTSALNSEGDFLPKTIAYLIITDSDGHKVGYDPRSGIRYKEFDAGWTITGPNEEIEGFEITLPLAKSGTYTIEVIEGGGVFGGGSGAGVMQFAIEFAFSRESTSEGFYREQVTGLLDKGLTSKFQMTYNSDPSKPAGSVVKVASPSSLKQDIALSRKIGWIDNDGIMMSLYKKAEAIEKSIDKGDKGTAKNQIEAFINEVNAQKGKHLTDEAVKMLLEDTQYLVEHL